MADTRCTPQSIERLNATSREGKVKCGTCGRQIKAGERLLVFRERALTSHEARHAGTQYPKRYRCSGCVERLSAWIESQEPSFTPESSR